MKVLEKINNNAALCIDSSGNKIVAIGTGIGFPKVPYELADLNKIQKTYYDIDPRYLNVLNQVSPEVFDIAAQIIQRLRDETDSEISSNAIFTLADHIDFAIVRSKKGIFFGNPMQYELQHLYEREYSIGVWATRLINQTLHVHLPQEEASNITLHLINAQELPTGSTGRQTFKEKLNDITEIIANHFDIRIYCESMNYSRFVSHMEYLMKRIQRPTKERSNSENIALFEKTKQKYPETYACVQKIVEYLSESAGMTLDEEEQLYLMLHVNRLRVREGL